MDAILKKIRDFAAAAHGGQTRKYTPEPYIVHPVRVMEICSRYSNSLPVLAAALLHDVLEDTAVKKEEIHSFLLQYMKAEEAVETTKLVVELTDVYTKENYPQWNRKTRKQHETERLQQVRAAAQTVKYADIIDNCREIVRYDKQFGPKFLKECRQLLGAIKKGHPELYRLALSTVNEEMKKIAIH